MKITIGFTGDIAFSEYTKDLYKKPNLIDKKIYKFFNNNDYNVLNFESPITESNITKKAALTHKSNIESLKFVKSNVKNVILSLANNHMMDFGVKGILDTLNAVEKEKTPIIGAGKNEDEATNYIIVGDKIKVGIISAQYKDYLIATKNLPGPAHNKHFKLIKNKITELKTKVDWVVMVYHGGEEFINTPLPYTRRLYKKFLSWGADVVVAHHPHTVQGYEKVKDKYIFYSLGNFIFDTNFQRAQYGTDEGMLLKLEFTKDSYSFENFPIKRNRDEETIDMVEKSIHFKDIKRNYKKNWKKEALRLTNITIKKKELKKYRNMFLISNLYIEKAKYENLISFDQLIKKYYISELDEPPVFTSSNIIARKIRKFYRKFKNANYKKFFYTHYAKIFK